MPITWGIWGVGLLLICSTLILLTWRWVLLIPCCLLLSLEAGGLLRALTQFSHLAADTIINGSATAHTAPIDHADRKQYYGILASPRYPFYTFLPLLSPQHVDDGCVFFHLVGLTENCRGCATQSLQYLKDLKAKATIQKADPASIRIIVQKILHLGQASHTNTIFTVISLLLASVYIQNTWFVVFFCSAWSVVGNLVLTLLICVFWLLLLFLLSTGAEAKRHGYPSGRTGRFGG